MSRRFAYEQGNSWPPERLSVSQKALSFKESLYKWVTMRCYVLYENSLQQKLCNNTSKKTLAMFKWVHCHHGMARPRVADRGDGLQIWRVSSNILNKQSRTADSGWSSSLGVGRGLTTLPHKTQYLFRNTTYSLCSGRIIWHNLSTRKQIWD
jgi:hypothetical protein